MKNTEKENVSLLLYLHIRSSEQYTAQTGRYRRITASSHHFMTLGVCLDAKNKTAEDIYEAYFMATHGPDLCVRTPSVSFVDDEVNFIETRGRSV